MTTNLSYNLGPIHPTSLVRQGESSNSPSGPQRSAPPAVTQLSPTLLAFTAASETSPPQMRDGEYT